MDTQAPDRGVGVVAEAGTTYTINGSEVQVGADAQVSLLFDEIINNQGNDRTQQLETAALSKLGQPADGYQYAYEFKYLDLVDASNGNAWVAASKDNHLLAAARERESRFPEGSALCGPAPQQ